LSGTWALDVDEIRYLPKGAGSYHWIGETGGGAACFITVDDLDTKPWIGGGRDATFAGLGAAYEAASTLHHDVGLAFVVSPLRGLNGQVVLRLSDRYSMAVFPFVEGRAGGWGDPLTDPDRDDLLRVLAGLHHAAHPSGLRMARRPLDLPERPILVAVLGALDRPWEGGPFSEPARRALAGHVQGVTARLELLDLLASRLEEADDETVLTHGEPHPGNFIHTAEGLRLIDWDTVALARPERDLWMLDSASPGVLVQYENLVGRSVNDSAISFYRLAWTLSDLAYFADSFRSAHEESESIRQQWSEFECLLDGAHSAPYAVT
jgi:spectinomycin phosphotransferase